MNFNKRLRLAEEKFEAGKKARDSLKYQEAADNFLAAAELSKGIKGNEANYARYLLYAANALDELGCYDKAKSLLEKAIRIQKKIFGSEHLDVAGSLNNLAVVYSEQGGYEQAEELYKKALAIREKSLGSEHPDIADSLNNLANIYCEQGDYEQAEQLYKKALAIREKSLGSEHLDVAQSLNNLANVYGKQGNYEQAEQLQKKDLAICEKSLGFEHPDVAGSLNNLAGIYQAQGNYEQAKQLHEKALAIQEKAFGSEHPAVASSLNNLAIIYKANGDYEQAKQLHEKALAIWEKVLGFEHPDVATSLNNLANVYSDQGDYEKAKQLHEKALAIREKSLGSEHPDIAISLNNLANIYQKNGDYEQAKKLYEKSLGIIKASLGYEHNDIAANLNNLISISQIQQVDNQPNLLEKKVEKPSTSTIEDILRNYSIAQQEIEELRKRNIEQLVALEEAKKLEYLSYMATGIAHNINNPVGIIRLAAQRGLRELEKGISVEKGQDIFQRILTQANRLHGIIQDFRDYAKGDRKNMENVELNKVVEHIKGYFENQLAAHQIKLNIELAENPCAQANNFVLQEVLINLISNAREALENIPDANILIKTWQTAEKVGFIVEDNGTGVSVEQQASLFSPFYSTKADGTGLGLHFAHKSITEMHGTIRYENRIPNGACFIIELPSTRGENP